MKIYIPTDEELNKIKKALYFNTETNEFTWLIKTSDKVQIGQRAGSQRPDGYRLIMIYGKRYYEHHLVWYFTTGVWPKEQIDHISGDTSDNSPSNLREANDAQNRQNMKKYENNSSGYPNVTWNKRANKWQAQIGNNGKNLYLGIFNTQEEAYQEVVKAKATLHKFQPTYREQLNG